MRNDHPVNTAPTLKDTAVDFLRLVASGQVREAYRRHVAPEFRHHNPFFRGDAESLMAAMEENAVKNPAKVLEIQRAVQEGDLVAVHSRVRQRPDDAGGAVVHLFRFHGDRHARSRTAFRIRRAGHGDEEVVRSLRLQALSDSPDDFDSTLSRESAWTTPDWQRWIAEGATFVLEDSGEPKGIAAGVPNRDDRASVFLISMWLHPALRGTGAASALVASVVSWAVTERATDVWLHVVKGNERARRCYEKSGFRATGREVLRERDGVVEVEMRRGADRLGCRAPGFSATLE